MPLRVRDDAAQMQDTQDVTELQALLVELFGADHLDTGSPTVSPRA